MCVLTVFACAAWTSTLWVGGQPFATSVVSYDPGIDPTVGFTDPSAALGRPTRITSPDHPAGGVVTPFQPAFGADELVSLGAGGTLVLRLDDPVDDQPGTRSFGMELLVFGNAFFTGSPAAAGPLASEPATIELSQDGTTWLPVTAVADAAFPTLGYADLSDPFASTAGTISTDFHRPVDPTLELEGMSFDEIVTAYAGAGGGTGIDIGETGLTWVQYIRFTNPHAPGSGVSPEIDGVTVVLPHKPTFSNTLETMTPPVIPIGVPEPTNSDARTSWLVVAATIWFFSPRRG